MNCETISDKPPLVTINPYPKSLTCVKSLPNILLLPAVCTVISIGFIELALSKTCEPYTVPVQPALLFELGSSISVAVPSVGSQSLTALTWKRLPSI